MILDRLASRSNHLLVFGVFHASSLRRCATWRWLPLRRSTPSPSPANSLRQRCRVVSPTPNRATTSRARAPAATAASRLSRALRRSCALVSPPRPRPSWPGSFGGVLLRSLRLQQCCRLRQGLVLATQLLLQPLDLPLILLVSFGGPSDRPWTAAARHWHQVPPARWPKAR